MNLSNEPDDLTEDLLELVDVEVLVKAVQSVPDVSDTDALRDALIDCLRDAVDLSALPGFGRFPEC